MLKLCFLCLTIFGLDFAVNFEDTDNNVWLLRPIDFVSGRVVDFASFLFLTVYCFCKIKKKYITLRQTRIEQTTKQMKKRNRSKK